MILPCETAEDHGVEGVDSRVTRVSVEAWTFRPNRLKKFWPGAREKVTAAGFAAVSESEMLTARTGPTRAATPVARFCSRDAMMRQPTIG